MLILLLIYDRLYERYIYFLEEYEKYIDQYIFATTSY